ncbi:MAG TPA: hypothetical protein VIT43_01975 [Candidatus Dormibacteraeota bacterium]
MKTFLRYYVELPFPLREVDRAIAQLPAEWLNIAARDAYVRAALMLATQTGEEVGLGAADVSVSLAASSLVDGILSRSIRWLAAGLDQPLLHGDLELAELGPCRTQIALSAQHLSFPRVSPCTSRAGSQRIGESTLKAFVDRMASYVEDVLGSRQSAIPRNQRAVAPSASSLPHCWVAAP